MKLQQLLSYTRKAVDDYQMIEEGDKIAVGVSGGKDSLTLLYALKGLQRFYPKHFELLAVTVNLGCDRYGNCGYYLSGPKRGKSLFPMCKDEKRCSEYRGKRIRL